MSRLSMLEGVGYWGMSSEFADFVPYSGILCPFLGIKLMSLVPME